MEWGDGAVLGGLVPFVNPLVIPLESRPVRLGSFFDGVDFPISVLLPPLTMAIYT